MESKLTAPELTATAVGRVAAVAADIDEAIGVPVGTSLVDIPA